MRQNHDPTGRSVEHLKANCLTISIVTYFPDFVILAASLDSLQRAIKRLQEQHDLQVKLSIVDNSVNQQVAERLAEMLQGACSEWAELICTESNLGYGSAHNLAVTKKGCGLWHLVMNADVELEQGALLAAILFLEDPRHHAIGLLSPNCSNGEGQKTYLSKRYPSLLDFALRGFAPARLRQLFKQRLAYYEYRGQTEDKPVYDIPIVSGCFMFFRGQAWQQSGGFSSSFFLYFEDFDLCMRLHSAWQIAYAPQVQIVHHGGHAARKGFKHVYLFIQSAKIFFSRHGWRLI